jgi:hypothetical protein
VANGFVREHRAVAGNVEQHLPEVVLRPTTRAEAGEQLSRRATQLFRDGSFTTLREALAEAMRERPYLKPIYAEG